MLARSPGIAEEGSGTQLMFDNRNDVLDNLASLRRQQNGVAKMKAVSS